MSEENQKKRRNFTDVNACWSPADLALPMSLLPSPFMSSYL